MPEWVNKTIKHNPGEKSFKKPFVIYLDLECILKKLQSHNNNSNNNNNSNSNNNSDSNNNNNNNNIEESDTEKKAKHEPSGWVMFIKCSFDKKETKLNHYRRKDCIVKLCKKLKESATEIINHEKKEMIPLTKK